MFIDTVVQDVGVGMSFSRLIYFHEIFKEHPRAWENVHNAILSGSFCNADDVNHFGMYFLGHLSYNVANYKTYENPNKTMNQ